MQSKPPIRYLTMSGYEANVVCDPGVYVHVHVAVIYYGKIAHLLWRGVSKTKSGRSSNIHIML